MENYLKPRQIMTIIIRWWWVILLITSTAIAMGYFFSKNQTPVYEASATVMVGDSIQSTQLSRDDIGYESLMEATERYGSRAYRRKHIHD